MTRKEIILVIASCIASVGMTLGVSALIKDRTAETAEVPHQGLIDNDAVKHQHATLERKPTEADLTAQTQVDMDIIDNAYSKPIIKIKKGTTVTWTNQDTVEHSVMQEPEGSARAQIAPAKNDVKPDVFAGQLLAKGESYSFTFNKAGKIVYHCALHPYMTGVVTVVE